MAQKRSDKSNRRLKKGERQRSNGTYEFRWRDRMRKTHSIYAKTLEELREKENDVTRNILDGIEGNTNLTLNDMYEKWLKVKKGLKRNTLQNYRYMYEKHVMPSFGNIKISTIKKIDVKAFYNKLSGKAGMKVSTIDTPSLRCRCRKRFHPC